MPSAATLRALGDVMLMPLLAVMAVVSGVAGLAAMLGGAFLGLSASHTLLAAYGFAWGFGGLCIAIGNVARFIRLLSDLDYPRLSRAIAWSLLAIATCPFFWPRILTG